MVYAAALTALAWSAPAMTQPSTDSAAIEIVLRDVYKAMLAADTATLALAHITSVVQPRADRLGEIDRRRMAYLSAQEVSVTARSSGNAATAVARHVVDATIDGGRSTWSLQLAANLARRDGRWIVAKMVATTFR